MRSNQRTRCLILLGALLISGSVISTGSLRPCGNGMSSEPSGQNPLAAVAGAPVPGVGQAAEVEDSINIKERASKPAAEKAGNHSYG